MTLKVSFAGAVTWIALTSFAQAADMQPVLKAPGAQPEQQATGYVEVYSGWASTRDMSNFSCDGCGSGRCRNHRWRLGRGGQDQLREHPRGERAGRCAGGRHLL